MMTDLSTTYMGLELRNPLVASASPLSRTVDGVRELAAAGVGAIVMYSLFEEQVRREAELNARLADAGTESFAESLSYFPDAADEDPGPRRYLSLLERAVAAVDVPVIASLNGVTPDGWVSYATAMQDAGADVVMTASALLRHGPGHAAVLLDGLTDWMARKGFADLDAVRGLLAVRQDTDEAAHERAEYVSTMRVANRGVYEPW